MSLFVLDTDILTLYQRGHPQVRQQVDTRPPAEVAITVISVQEQLEGWRARLSRAKTRQQTAQAYLFLTVALVPSLRVLEVLPFPEIAIARFEQLLTFKVNVGRMDLRIAAIALEASAVVVTRNKRDFSRVPGLTLEDWSV